MTYNIHGNISYKANNSLINTIAFFIYPGLTELRPGACWVLPSLFVLKRLLSMPHIVEQSFADARFGIDDVASADNGKRDLPTVP